MSGHDDTFEIYEHFPKRFQWIPPRVNGVHLFITWSAMGPKHN